MSIKILCIGDVHLGRLPTRLPEELECAAQIGPREALSRAVAAAAAEGVDGVMFTGDVVDASNALFEAYSALAETVSHLLDSKIPVFAVAGNHDFGVLDRLAAELPGFRLIGRGGVWEDVILPAREGRVRIQGRSFSNRYETESPMIGYTPPTDGLPTIAMLHCDVDSPGSRFAPVALADLAAQPIACWVLGHVHKPAVLRAADPLILYPGSLQGLDPGEEGLHGAWIIDLGTGGKVKYQPVAAAALIYLTLALDLNGVTDLAEVMDRSLQTLRDWHKDNQRALAGVQALCLRFRAEGRTEVCGKLHRILPELKAQRYDLDGLQAFVDGIINATVPAVSLEKLSGEKDLPGLLASRLLVISSRAPEQRYTKLLAEARKNFLESLSSSARVALGDEADISDEELRGFLMDTGLTALEELLSQKAGPL